MASSPKYHPHLGSKVGQPLLLTPSLTSRGATAGCSNHALISSLTSRGATVGWGNHALTPSLTSKGFQVCSSITWALLP